MKKRIISAALAAIMATSAFAVSASAAGLKSDGTLEAASTVKVPEMKVTVPESAAFVVNPYKLSVTVGSSTVDDTVIATYGDGKTSWDIENASEEIAVSAKIYATYKAGKAVEVNATTADETKKQISLTLKVNDGEDKEVKLLTSAPSAWTDTSNVTSFTLAKKTGENNGKASITLTGTATATEGLAWTDADTVAISMVFKFDMVANGASSSSSDPDPDPVVFTATFAGLDDATPATIADIEADEDGKLTLPAAPTKDGFTFTKWKAGDNEYNAGAEVTITANTTFTAQWDEN